MCVAEFLSRYQDMLLVMLCHEDVFIGVGGILEEGAEAVVDLPEWGSDEFLLGPFLMGRN